jgi:hypothetical protein
VTGAYASSAVSTSPEAYAEEAVAFKANGRPTDPPADPLAQDIRCATRCAGDLATTYDHARFDLELRLSAAVRGRAIEGNGFRGSKIRSPIRTSTTTSSSEAAYSVMAMGIRSPGTQLRTVDHAQATDYLRGDVAVKGGITTLVKTAHLAEAFRMNYEVHHGGNSLNNVANLHVIMAIRNTEFFEVLLPDGAQKYGLAEDITVGRDGMVHAPGAPGLGYEIDFALIERKKISVLT